MGGYIIRDFTDYAETREQVESRRVAQNARAKRSRVSRRDSGVSHAEVTEQSRVEQSRVEQRSTTSVVDEAPPARPPVVAPDHTDSDAETVIPLDLVDRAKAAGVLTQLADGLGQPVVSVEHAAREFVAYWTIGGGAGQRRRHWMRKLRQQIHESHKRNQLTPPGAIEHRDGSQSGRAMSPAVAAFLAGGRGSA